MLIGHKAEFGVLYYNRFTKQDKFSVILKRKEVNILDKRERMRLMTD